MPSLSLVGLKLQAVVQVFALFDCPQKSKQEQPLIMVASKRQHACLSAQDPSKADGTSVSTGSWKSCVNHSKMGLKDCSGQAVVRARLFLAAWLMVPFDLGEYGLAGRALDW